MTRLFCDSALLADGWARDVVIEIDDDGWVTAVAEAATPGDASRVNGPVIPGMPNLHSHAFQRAMAGLAERLGDTDNSFWTWRRVMYDFVDRLGPDEIEAIAAELYVEMLKAGYTAVGEFHYLHHRPDGGPYDDVAELSHRIVRAAGNAGIGLTLLPVLYAHGGFGAAPPEPGQRRFLNDVDRLFRIFDRIAEIAAGAPQIAVGIAPHSIRAVGPDFLAEAVAALDQRDRRAPIHIHIAEQTAEVDECLAWSGARSVAWLLDHAAVDERWCLVHATHMDGGETDRLARTGAVVGLCPTTEANLGDGLFPAPAYLAAGGRFGIGSDSQISISPTEELRWLEYGQRLAHRARNLLVPGTGRSVGAALWQAALAGGAQALGRPIGSLAPGRRADLLVLDGTDPTLHGRVGDLVLDGLVFAGHANPIRDVMVGGQWLVEDGRHVREDEIARRYRAAIAAVRP